MSALYKFEVRVCIECHGHYHYMSIPNHEGHFSTFKRKIKTWIYVRTKCNSKAVLKIWIILYFVCFISLYIKKQNVWLDLRDQMMTAHIHIVYREGRLLERSKWGPKTIWNWTTSVPVWPSACDQWLTWWYDGTLPLVGSLPRWAPQKGYWDSYSVFRTDD